MQYGVYKNLYIQKEYSVFEFFSIGTRGVIPKRIVFEPTEQQYIYNLVMGDVDINNMINVNFVSNNGDRNKVLATIVYIVEIYLKKHPERWVYFKGNTEEKTRLYRMAVGNNLELLLLKFEIYSRIENKVLPFQKNMAVDGFLIKIKA